MSRTSYRSPTKTRRKKKLEPLAEETAMHGYISAAADTEAVEPQAAISSGIPSLDVALGGGYPKGVVELWGPESSGKTALLAHGIASAQASDKDVALVCTEYLDVPYFEAIGVDASRLFVVKPFEDRLLGKDLEHFAVGFTQVPGNVLILDSLTSARKLLQDDIEWNTMALELVDALAHYSDPESLVLASSQVRTKFFRGRPTARTRSASDRLFDMFSASIELSRSEVHTRTYTLCLDVKRNVLSQPGRYLEVPASKGAGVMVENDLLDLLTGVGMIEKAGNYWYVEETTLGPGYKNAGVQLHELQLFEPLYRRVLSAFSA